jgi:hypothetical protein
MMRHALFSTSIDSSTPVISNRTARRKGVFALVLEALHHSRRLQAERIIRQYRHLLASSEPRDSKPNVGGQ